MAQAGIKYFSTAPNYIDRIGDILQKWENRPFYWVSPSGKEKVLVWIPTKGYAMSHIVHTLTPQFVAQYQDELERTGYPYDIAYIRWSGHGDNATPDPAICEFVKQWNEDHAWPKFKIASTSEAFRALEARVWREAAASARRLDALLGRWRRVVGRRDRDQPGKCRSAQPGRDSLGHAQPGKLSREGL